MWAAPRFAKWSISASWSLCGKVWNPIVVADTCGFCFVNKKIAEKIVRLGGKRPKGQTTSVVLASNLHF